MPLQITDKPVGFSPGFVAPGWDCGGSVASELLTTEQVLSDGCKMNAPRGRSDWQLLLFPRILTWRSGVSCSSG
ncbi:hypothetical protein CDO27_35455 (plasmid) [Sinorhizobium meliloti]|nr:hypothetical protein CDO27_35455 [Sinorhizobium meliloti]CCM69619.1 hypothetical protein BN406_06682 [Sinorhizobium meliloti Rm41]